MVDAIAGNRTIGLFYPFLVYIHLMRYTVDNGNLPAALWARRQGHKVSRFSRFPPPSPGDFAFEVIPQIG